MPEKGTLIAIRVEDARYVVYGSQPGTCTRCGHLVWLSLSAQQRISDLEVVCMHCLPVEELEAHGAGEPLDREEVLAADGDPDIGREEIIRRFRKWKARH